MLIHAQAHVYFHKGPIYVRFLHILVFLYFDSKFLKKALRPRAFSIILQFSKNCGRETNCHFFVDYSKRIKKYPKFNGWPEKYFWEFGWLLVFGRPGNSWELAMPPRKWNKKKKKNLIWDWNLKLKSEIEIEIELEKQKKREKNLFRIFALSIIFAFWPWTNLSFQKLFHFLKQVCYTVACATNEIRTAAAARERRRVESVVQTVR